uniref:Uncharacterized protein n=1 Tax=Pipistrellus kuhlii TaxID=59472 RepID=A0A7J8A9G2_PIPKU|nr:hypothetical protein mPipKuh1_008956 [Pipistrellus kuhlii]
MQCLLSFPYSQCSSFSFSGFPGPEKKGVYIKTKVPYLACVSQWLSIIPCTIKFLVRFSVSAHALVVALIPSSIQEDDRCFSFILMFLYLSLFFFSLKSVKTYLYKTTTTTESHPPPTNRALAFTL